MAVDTPRLMKPSTFAQRLNVGERTVLKWLQTGVIRGIRLPTGTWRIEEAELERIIAAGRNEQLAS